MDQMWHFYTYVTSRKMMKNMAFLYKISSWWHYNTILYGQCEHTKGMIMCKMCHVMFGPSHSRKRCICQRKMEMTIDIYKNLHKIARLIFAGAWLYTNKMFSHSYTYTCLIIFDMRIKEVHFQPGIPEYSSEVTLTFALCAPVQRKIRDVLQKCIF